MNKIFLYGNLTRDPELTSTSSGNSVCKFSLAVNEKYGETEEVNFFNITAFGSRGEAIQKYVSKGDKLLVEGKVKVSDYEKEGIKKRSWEVILSNFEFVPNGKRASASEGGEDYQDHSYEPVQQEAKKPAAIDEDDLPF